MIWFKDVSVTYPDSGHPTLEHVNIRIDEGQLALVVGPTGSGKSTFLKAINGLVPHFTGGSLTGHVVVDDRDTATNRPRDLADVVGYVGQDPVAGFVTDAVEDELAYSMESLGIAPSTMRRRVEETLDLLGLADLRHRPLSKLSGGERQRVAIGSVLTAQPRILVLDEPTSALDPQAAEEVLAGLQRLVHDLGLTVVLAEHRLERVIQYADEVIRVGGPGRPVTSGAPQTMMQDSPVAPPVVGLGRLMDWSPLPLSVRDARRQAVTLRARLDVLPPPSRPGRAGNGVARMEAMAVTYGSSVALRGVDWDLTAGRVTALMGRNGAGKSTILKALCGLVRPSHGRVRVDGLDPASASAAEVIRHVGLVPQEAGDLLFCDTVAEECRIADKDAHAEPGTCRRLVSRLVPGVEDSQHPRDLSEGQRLVLALSVVLVARPSLVLLDEPTRGLDYLAKAHLVEVLAELRADGHGVVVATHDVELAAEVADEVVVVAEGELVARGPAAEVLVASPAFAPQTAKIVAPLPYLTVSEVAAALRRETCGAG